MDRVIYALERKRGRATFAELVKATSRRELAAAVKDGSVERLARGIYVLPGLDTDRCTAAAYDGVVSHLSAAVAWDLPLLVPPEKPHITIPPNRHSRPGPPAVLHWAAVAPGFWPSRLTSVSRSALLAGNMGPRLS